MAIYKFMSGMTPLTLQVTQSVELDKGYVTTLNSSETEDRGVLLAGTSQGYILKVITRA